MRVSPERSAFLRPISANLTNHHSILIAQEAPRGSPMTERIQKNELARRLAERMQTDIPTATAWSDGIVETRNIASPIIRTANGVPAQQAAVADAAARRQDRADFESWFQLDRFPNLSVRRS